MTRRTRRQLARAGCPIGSLATELAKDDEEPAAAAAALPEDWLRWLAGQFAELRRPDPVGDARHLLACLQGASLIAHVLNRPGLVADEADQLARWVGSL